MQTCKSDIVMLDQAYAKKTGIYCNARLRNKTQKKQQEKPKHNAPPNRYIRWAKCKV